MAFAVVVNMVEKIGGEREISERQIEKRDKERERERKKNRQRQSDERERDKVVAKSAFSYSGSINRKGAQ